MADDACTLTVYITIHAFICCVIGVLTCMVLWHAEQPEIGLMALVLRRAVAQSIGGAQLQGTAHTALQRPPKRKDEMTVLDIRPRGLAHHIIMT